MGEDDYIDEEYEEEYEEEYDEEEELEIIGDELIDRLGEQKIQQILFNLTKIQKDSSDKQITSILEGIKKELNCLV